MTSRTDKAPAWDRVALAASLTELHIERCRDLWASASHWAAPRSDDG